MELQDLRVLLAAVQHGSLLGAADALGMARATLRARLEHLERELGLPLLVRTPFGVTPTAQGAQFVERARALLAEADSLARFGQTEDETLAGELVVRGPAGLPPELAALFLREVHRLHPQLRVVADTRADPTAGADQEVDIILHFGAAPPSGPFRTCGVLQVPEVLLASPDYLAAHGTPTRPEDLHAHTLLSWQPPGEDGRDWPLRAGGVLRVQPTVLSPEIHVLRMLTIAGMGIARLPDPEVARGLLPGEPLVQVLPEGVGRESALRVLIPEARARTARSRMALRLIRELAGGVLQPPRAPEGGVTDSLQPPEPRTG